MVARIYRPARTATQSGRAKTVHWVLEMEPQARAKEAGPSVRLDRLGRHRAAAAAALSRARRRRSPMPGARASSTACYEPHERIVRPKSYAENFIRRT